MQLHKWPIPQAGSQCIQPQDVPRKSVLTTDDSGTLVKIKFRDKCEHRERFLQAVLGNQAFRTSGSSERLRGIYSSDDKFRYGS